MDHGVQTHYPGPTGRAPGDDASHVNASHHDKHEGHSPEMFRDRLWVSLLLTVPILYFSPQIQDWYGYEAVEFPGSHLITPVLATALYLYGGGPFLTGAAREARMRRPGMMTLITIAITVAYTYSMAVALGFPGDPFYWELATLIDVMLLGHWMEMRSVVSASSALDELAKLVPSEAHLLHDDSSISDTPIESLKLGDRIVVRPGEQIPIDGDVVEGESSVDEAFLTGESKPVSKKAGSEVIAGAINGEGALTVAVSRTGDDTTLSQIMRLVEDAQASRSQFQALADRAALWLTIIAIGVAVPTFIVWLVAGAGITFAVTRTVTVLVIACPHARGLAIPLVTANATDMAAQNGILVKNREAFERGRDIRFVALDKTGTLTEGRFAVSDVAVDGPDRVRALQLAAALERNSEHPIAAAIVEADSANGAHVVNTAEARAVPGQGITGSVDGTRYAVGRPEWVTERGDSISQSMAAALTGADDRGDTAVVLIEDHTVRAVISMADRPRPTAPAAIQALEEMGITPIMVSGDAEAVARNVAGDLGINRYIARVLPDEKATIVSDLETEGKVAFVGDGINDAPALLQADLGIAIGAGTNVAIESADLVLVDDDPRGVARALRLSRLTRSKMLQNLGWATGYNVIAIPLAAGVAYTAGILLSPAIGALLMSLSTVIVALNAMSMRRASLS